MPTIAQLKDAIKEHKSKHCYKITGNKSYLLDVAKKLGITFKPNKLMKVNNKKCKITKVNAVAPNIANIIKPEKPKAKPPNRSPPARPDPDNIKDTIEMLEFRLRQEINKPDSAKKTKNVGILTDKLHRLRVQFKNITGLNFSDIDPYI